MKSKVTQFKYYDIILAIFASLLLLSNLSATKLIEIGPVITDGGVILFPIAYIFGNILTEVYGYKYTRRAIWVSFFMMLIAVAAFTIVQALPPASDWENQEAFEAILGFFPRIVLASLTAYLVGKFINAYVLAKMKLKTKGKYLGVRFVASTAAGQLIDTIIFGLIAFGGILSGSAMLRFILIGWVLKISVEILLLPLSYRIVRFLKKHEHADAFDTSTNFNPLKIKI